MVDIMEKRLLCDNPLGFKTDLSPGVEVAVSKREKTGGNLQTQGVPFRDRQTDVGQIQMKYCNSPRRQPFRTASISIACAKQRRRRSLPAKSVSFADEAA